MVPPPWYMLSWTMLSIFKGVSIERTLHLETNFSLYSIMCSRTASLRARRRMERGTSYVSDVAYKLSIFLLYEGSSVNEDILCNIRQDARVQYNENNCRSTMKPEN